MSSSVEELMPLSIGKVCAAALSASPLADYYKVTFFLKNEIITYM